MRRAVYKTRELEKRAMNSERLAVGTLAGGLAHEIKNPLSTFNINLQLLKEDMQVCQRKQQKGTLKIQSLQKEVQRLEEILNDYLRFAKGQKLELENHDINEILDDVVGFCYA